MKFWNEKVELALIFTGAFCIEEAVVMAIAFLLHIPMIFFIWNVLTLIDVLGIAIANRKTHQEA